MQAFLETKPTGVDGGEINAIVGSVDHGDGPPHFLLAQDAWQSPFLLNPQVIEGAPRPVQDVGEENRIPA